MNYTKELSKSHIQQARRLPAPALLPSGIDQFPPAFIRQCGAIVLSLDDEQLTVGVLNTDDIALLQDIRSFTPQEMKDSAPKRFHFVQIDAGDLSAYIHQYLEDQQTDGGVSMERGNGEAPIDELVNNAPMISLVNSILGDAIQAGASDIHIEGGSHDAMVRFRIDGVLMQSRRIATRIYPAILARLKVMASLNIIEKRRPQDGRISVIKNHQRTDIRVSTVPTAKGESLVLRILNAGGRALTLPEIGFPLHLQRELERRIALPQGLMLVTGPTGSGKTTTLHAFLQHINDGSRKIISIEDPVEYSLDGIEQIQINQSIGLDFPSILKRVLRQDPNVIMIGEIRDSETARIAIRAAMTGHLVLSTLHTNDALSSVHRLMDLGIEDYLLASVLEGIIAQRLVRMLCQNCKQPSVGEGTWIPKGCAQCNGSGYRGRIALSHTMLFDTNVLKASNVHKHLHDGEGLENLLLRAECKDFSNSDNASLSGLAADGARLVREGVTSREELQRIGVLP